MKTIARTLTALALGAIGLGTAAAAGKVEVRFVDPEHFADAGRGPWEIARTTQTVEKHFKELAQQLPDGQSLSVEVLDIDLAGELRLVRTQEVRIMRGRADWPRMKLRYTLSADGHTLRTGEEALSDMNYLQNSLRPAPGTDLAYDLRMVDAWFDKHIAPH